MPSAPPRHIQIAERTFGSEQLFLIAGPCVLESLDLTLEIAETLKELCAARELPLIFKASYDKANRTSLESGRGPGIETGLRWLEEVKTRLEVPVTTDVHHPEQCATVAEVADLLQIPAFLCRQTDLLVAAARTGAAVNVKKGQFLAPWDAGNALEKCIESGNRNVMITERGTTFGYGRLVVDMSGLPSLAATGQPVVFDATHSVQQPGSLGKATGGNREAVPLLARAALATGSVDGLFFEVHPTPDTSPSDAANTLHLSKLGPLLDQLVQLSRLVGKNGH
jgi:2-dehydro-3-deoxyphosphooctonate aldolase (KDO 8-P synthase)